MLRWRGGVSIGRAGLVDVVSLRVSVGGEAAVWTTFFSPLDTFVGFFVAVVVGVSFHSWIKTSTMNTEPTGYYKQLMTPQSLVSQ